MSDNNMVDPLGFRRNQGCMKWLIGIAMVIVILSMVLSTVHWGF